MTEEKAKVFFELYDEVTGDTVSYHQTIKGAMKAMSLLVTNLVEPMARDYEPGIAVNGNPIEFKLSFRVIGHKLEE